MSIVFLFDENPDVASAGSGGAAVEVREVCRITPLALTSTDRLHKKPFACLPTALRPSGPVQQWIFHQAEKELTTLPGLRYSSGHRKGRLKILSIDDIGKRLAPYSRGAKGLIQSSQRE